MFIMKNCSMNDDEKNKYGEKVSFHVLMINLFLSIIKIVAGFLGNSMALVADAVHSFSDALSTIGVIICLRISKKPPDQEHPYGHGKVESIAAKIIALILIAVGLGLLVTAVMKVIEGTTAIPKGIALWATLLSIAVKEFSYRYTIKVATELNSTLLAADAWHHRSDVLTSIAALIGITAARFGYPIWDPIMAGIVSLFVMKVGVEILRDSIDELMDKMPDQEIIPKIQSICSMVNGVKNTRNIKIRKYGMYLHVDLIIEVDPEISVAEGHQLATTTKVKIIEDMGAIREVFIHIDPIKE